MRVLVDSNIEVSGVFKPPMEVELEDPNPTLRTLLEKFSSICRGIELINPESNDLGEDVEEVILNGAKCLLPEHLSIRLNEGDEVTIKVLIAPLGGG